MEKYIPTSPGSFPHHLLSTLDEEEDQESINYPSSHQKETTTDGTRSSSRGVGARGREARGEKDEEQEGSSSSAHPLSFVSTSSLSSLPIPIPGLRSRVSSFDNLASSYSSTSSIAPRLEEDDDNDDDEVEEGQNDPERQVASQHRGSRGEEEGMERRKTRQHGLGAEDGRAAEVDELTARLLAGPEWAQTVRELEYGGSGLEKAGLTSLLTSQVESCHAEQRWYEANLALESLSAPHSNLWYVYASSITDC